VAKRFESPLEITRHLQWWQNLEFQGSAFVDNKYDVIDSCLLAEPNRKNAFKDFVAQCVPFGIAHRPNGY